MTETGSDEEKIRALVDRWVETSASGDLQAQLQLMDEDVLLLTCGHNPITRDEYAVSFESLNRVVRMAVGSSIQEISVLGDVAVLRNKVSVEMTPRGSEGSPRVREGHTLAVLRRGTDGAWRLWRDANFVPPR